ncbi:MAG TPA: HEAT repeat domain-containing protein, partial [Planctomycetes bacterium]|nr:HEAT repeat domain-containing protein [Planctomycetota bacterium]
MPPGNSTSPGTSNNDTLGSTVAGSSPSAPTSPAGGSGASGATGATGARAGRAASPRGYVVGDDLGRWEFWWEFGKDPYLRLRDTLYGDRGDDALARWNPRLATVKRRAIAPTAMDVTDVAVQIAKLLAKSMDRDTSSACLLALAKIGPKRAGFDLTDMFTRFLSRGDQELRESAALSLGISGSLDQATVQILTDLIEDNARG